MIGGVARFVGAFVAVALVLVVGILLGVNAVDKGIQRVEGGADKGLSGLAITRVDGDRVELTVMGERVTLDKGRLQEAKRPAVETPRAESPFLSRMGNAVGEWVRGLTRSAIQWMTERLGS